MLTEKGYSQTLAVGALIMVLCIGVSALVCFLYFVARAYVL